MMIRKLSPHDVERFRTLRLEALKCEPQSFGSSYEEELKFSLDRFKARLESDSTQVFGAFVGDALAGIVGLSVDQRRKTRHKASISSMYVSKDYRRQGLGRALMTAAIDIARQMGSIERIALSVVSSNEPAIQLYKNLGFEVFGLEKHALKIHGKYYDFTLMVLAIDE